MVKLRTEPKFRPPVTDEEYKQYKSLLQQAREHSTENQVFLDLEKNEKPGRVRKALSYVAEQESIPVNLRYSRKDRCFRVTFPGAKRKAGPVAGKPGAGKTRMSAEESRGRILEALERADEPLGKSDILEKTGIAPSSWNVRIKELQKKKKIEKIGTGRETKYRVK